MLRNLTLTKPILEVLRSFTVWITEELGFFFCEHAGILLSGWECWQGTLSPWSPTLDLNSSTLTCSGHLFSLKCAILTYLNISIFINTLELTRSVSVTTEIPFAPQLRALPWGWVLPPLGSLCSSGFGRKSWELSPTLSLALLLCFPSNELASRIVG